MAIPNKSNRLGISHKKQKNFLVAPAAAAACQKVNGEYVFALACKDGSIKIIKAQPNFGSFAQKYSGTDSSNFAVNNANCRLDAKYVNNTTVFHIGGNIWFSTDTENWDTRASYGVDYYNGTWVCAHRESKRYGVATTYNVNLSSSAISGSSYSTSWTIYPYTFFSGRLYTTSALNVLGSAREHSNLNATYLNWQIRPDPESDTPTNESDIFSCWGLPITWFKFAVGGADYSGGYVTVTNDQVFDPPSAYTRADGISETRDSSVWLFRKTNGWATSPFTYNGSSYLYVRSEQDYNDAGGVCTGSKSSSFEVGYNRRDARIEEFKVANYILRSDDGWNTMHFLEPHTGCPFNASTTWYHDFTPFGSYIYQRDYRSTDMRTWSKTPNWNSAYYCYQSSLNDRLWVRRSDGFYHTNNFSSAPTKLDISFSEGNLIFLDHDSNYYYGVTDTGYIVWKAK